MKRKSKIDAKKQAGTAVVYLEGLLRQDVVQVNCNSVLGQLDKKRFGSGSKGSCIRVDAEYLPQSSGQVAWMTPIEFENFCGKGSCRDWKRSIKVGGQPLSTLIEENILICHAISCTCGICNDNEQLRGPIKPFIKAKRRNTNEIRKAYDKFLSLKPPIFLKNSLVQKLSKLSDERDKKTASSPVAEAIARFEKQEREQWDLVEKALSNVAESVRSLETLIKESKEKSAANLRMVMDLVESNGAERSVAAKEPDDANSDTYSQRWTRLKRTRQSNTRLLIRKIQKKYSRCRHEKKSRNLT